MTDLAPLTALGADAPRSVTFGALTLTERPDIALASLALPHHVPCPAPFGLSLPDPGFVTVTGGTCAIWQAPRQWLIWAEGRADEDFAAILGDAAPQAAVTEQTDGWAALEVAGSVEPLIERMINLPLDALAPGRGTRTVIGHMSVIAIRRDAERLTLLAMRSMAGSLWHGLETCAKRLAASGA